jgi:Holliday junction resolvase-like predicted endonuclease
MTPSSAFVSDHRRRVGALAEGIAVDFLQRRGVAIVARNVKVDRGEVDLVVSVGRRRVVVEVRSVCAEREVLAADPVLAFDVSKANQVRRLANSLRVSRVDLVAVRFHHAGVDIHWVPNAA